MASYRFPFFRPKLGFQGYDGNIEISGSSIPEMLRVTAIAIVTPRTRAIEALRL